jgi:4-amino-4-deoxy-L-arabinose transferase-like glycosyltransferase
VKASKKTSEYVVIAVLLTLSSALILANLGNIYLWQDEAETALLAKSTLSHGLPIAYDGRNYISQALGRDNGKDYVHLWHPWFPFYLLAGFFALFGTSTFVARLPFALLGISTILLTYVYGKRLWRTRRAGVLAAVLLMSSVPFLLLVRQCRYYAPSAFFSLAGLYAYSEMLAKRRHASVGFVIAAVLLFNTHYVYCAALIASVVIHALIFRRAMLKSVLLSSAITIAVNVPGIIWFSGMWGALNDYGGVRKLAITSAEFYVSQIGKHIFHPALLLLPVLLYVIGRIRPSCRVVWDRGTAGNVLLLMIFSILTLVGTSLTNKYPFFRYLAPLIPIMCLLAALILDQGMRIHPGIAVAVILVLAWRGSMGGYLYEITHDYNGPIEGTILYLNANASPGDVVAVTHEDLPVKWYTNLRVIGAVTGEDFAPALNADWLVVRQTVDDQDYPFIDFLMENIPWDKYEQIALPYPDICFENREDPEEHHFRTAEDADPMVIFRRIRE